MDPTALKFPVIPMGTYLQESADLYAWLQPEKEKLFGAGLNRQMVESLPVRTGAARHAESIWKAQRFIKAEAQKQYNLESPAAYDLRDTTVHDMLFAYRNQPDVLGRVQKVAEGSGNADMLQDLSDLAVIGRTYPEPLQKINFDFEQLQKADDMVKMGHRQKSTVFALQCLVARGVSPERPRTVYPIHVPLGPKGIPPERL